MDCANCGCASAADFCPHCGQNNRDYRRALPPLILDLLRETFDIDSRLLRTVQQLLLKPGELSLEFSRNRRASYVSPFRLYLFVSVAFFFVLSMTTDVDSDFEDSLVIADVSQGYTDSDSSLDSLLQYVDEERQTKIRELVAGPENTIARSLILQIARDLSEQEVDQSLDSSVASQKSGFSIFVLSQLIDAVYEPREAFQRLFDNLPIALFFMLPVFALLLSIFYLGSRRYYIENLVFATHLHTFAFLIYGLMLLLPDTAVLDGMLLLVLFGYHFTALKRYYGEGYRRTFFKYLAQMLVYFVLLFPVVLLVLAVLTLATV